MTERPQSRGEEIANSVSHGVTLLAALVATPYLITAAERGGTLRLVGAAVFAATLVLLYFASTLYHALPVGPAKRVALKLDYGAIYLFIAGSYTPFALGLGGRLGWTLLALVWGLALVGITLKALDRLWRRWLSTGLYLVMGWLVIIAAGPLLERVPWGGIALIVAGGLAYTAGVAFFLLDSRVRYAHTVWHGFVMTGSGCHFFAVLGYAI